MKQWTAILGVCLIATVAAAVVTASADQTTKQDPNQAPATPETVKPAAPQPTSPPPPPPQGFAPAAPQNATPPAARQAQTATPNAVIQYPGQWVWDPYAGVWYWQILIPPTAYYVAPLSPYWWHGPFPPYTYEGPFYPPGKWTFTPNPNYRNTITGMLLLPPQEPTGQFKPGQSPTFPWNQPRTGSGFPPGVGAQGPWLPREPKDKEKPSK